MPTSPPSQLQSKQSLWSTIMKSMQMKAKYKIRSTPKQWNATTTKCKLMKFHKNNARILTCYGVPSSQDVLVFFHKKNICIENICIVFKNKVVWRDLVAHVRGVRGWPNVLLSCFNRRASKYPPPPSTSAISSHLFYIIFFYIISV